MIECLCVWTLEELKSWEKKPVLVKEFNAFFELEIPMPQIPRNVIQYFWSTKDFLGSKMFTLVIARQRFSTIPTALKIYSKNDHLVATSDPLWRLRVIIGVFNKELHRFSSFKWCSFAWGKSCQVKGSYGCSILHSVQPVKFSILFYVLFGGKYAYVHNLWNNDSGNWSNISPVSRYFWVHLQLIWAFVRKFDKNNVGEGKAFALWSLQLFHPTLKLHFSVGRLVVCNNSFKQNILDRQAGLLSDGEVKMIGTVWMNIVNACNRPAIKQDINKLVNVEKGCLFLFKALN